MGRFGVGLLVMSVSVVAYATEPSADGHGTKAPSPYAAVALADVRVHSAAHAAFETERFPPHPLRASMTSNEVAAVGVSSPAPRTIRVALETDASFPVDSNEAPVAATPAFSAPSRLRTIRRNLDDDAGVFEQTGATRRLIRRSLDDASDWASVSAGRRLRSTLD